MSKGPHVRAGVTHSTPDVTMTPDGQLRDANGLLIDEYVDESIRHEPGSDALDNPTALTDDQILDEVADARDGIEEIDTIEPETEAVRRDDIDPDPDVGIVP